MRIYEKKTVAGVLCTATVLRVNSAQAIGWLSFLHTAGGNSRGRPYLSWDLALFESNVNLIY